MTRSRRDARTSIAVWVLACAAAVALLAGVTLTADRADATVPCENAACPNGAAWSAAMGSMHWNQFAGHNCTNYVAWREITEGITIFAPGGEAEAWAASAAAVGIRVDDEPAVGAVAYWGAGQGGNGPSGHVAYVEQLDATSLTVSEDFYADGPFRWRTIALDDPGAPARYIHFEDHATPKFDTIVPAGDFSGDGRADAVAISNRGDLYLYPGDGSGSFAGSGIPLAKSWDAFTAVLGPGDLTGDGHDDLVAVATDGVLYVYPGDGTGGFGGAGVPIASGWGRYPRILAPGDFSGDGIPDLLTVSEYGELALHPGNGTGGLGAEIPIASSWDAFTTVLAPGDFSGDGDPDLLAVEANGVLYLYRGDGAGGFLGAGVPVASSWNGFVSTLAPGDFDGDGAADLVTVSPTGDLVLHSGNRAGGFAASRSIEAPW